ncbi:MAG: CD3072 family TudS-related putative desulfidase, partial [Thermoproteota archaeon]
GIFHFLKIEIKNRFSEGLEMFGDERSGRVAVVAHCILNQNSRVSGLSERSSMITEIIELLVEKDVGVIQMPCPELKYAGLLREGRTKEQYDSVMFRSYCRRLAEDIVDQILEYRKGEIRIMIIIGVDDSPSCGVGEELQARDRERGLSHHEMTGSGVLIEELNSVLRENNLSIPFYGVDYETLREDLANVAKIIED